MLNSMGYLGPTFVMVFSLILRWLKPQALTWIMWEHES